MPDQDWRQRRCPITIEGRPETRDGKLACHFTRGHSIPHRFMAPDATLRWWPVELGDPPGWEDAITTPATDPRWPEGHESYGRPFNKAGKREGPDPVV